MAKSNKVISLYSTWWIKPGKEKIVVPALKKLASAVKRKEKGKTLMYRVNLPIMDLPQKDYPKFKSEPVQRPGTVVFMEIYKDWSAFNDHFNGRVFNSFLKNFGKYFVQKAKVKGEQPGPFVQVVFCNPVAGFDSLG